ncbi:MAG: sodium:solute symporter family protein [Candidatus Latescibacteria bacterium]|nr:sodium:solute symporter family protein [Candidatus Latescibacterota bacterium]
MSQIPIITALCAYVFLTLLVGVYAGRRVKDSADFVVAGRRLGILLATGTLSATWFGTGTVLGAAGAAYKGGFLAVIADPFGAALCLFLAGLFYVRMMRRMGVSTIAEFFERRFGKTAGVVAAACTIPAYIGWVASLMVGFGKIIHALTGLDAVLGTCLGAVIVLIYTTIGGMWAVTLTDFIQVAVLTLGLIFMTPFLLSDMGGWAAIRAQLPDDQFYLYPRDADMTTWFNYARAWLVIGLGNLAGQDLLQRSLSSRNESVAQHSAYISGIIYLTVGLLPVFLGIAATLTFPNLADPEQVMMKLAETYLPPLGMAVFIGALISALMSSADSALLAPASVIGNDLIRYLRPDIDAQTQLRLCRLSVPVLGVIALYLALSHDTVYTLMVDSWSILLATLFVPLTAGIWWSKANRSGALWSMISGAIAYLILLQIAPDQPADLLAVPIGLLALVIITKATTKTDPPLPLSDTSGTPLAYENRLGNLNPFRGSSNQ